MMDKPVEISEGSRPQVSESQSSLHTSKPLDEPVQFEGERTLEPAVGAPSSIGVGALNSIGVAAPSSIGESNQEPGVSASSSLDIPDNNSSIDDLTEPTPDDSNESSQQLQPEPRHSERFRQPTERMQESIQQQGRKRKPEGEGENDRPAQHLRAFLAQMAPELLMVDREHEVNDQARAAQEKAGIRIPRSYDEAINDPIYGSSWKEAILRELTSLAGFGTWKIGRAHV